MVQGKPFDKFHKAFEHFVKPFDKFLKAFERIGKPFDKFHKAFERFGKLFHKLQKSVQMLWQTVRQISQSVRTFSKPFEKFHKVFERRGCPFGIINYPFCRSIKPFRTAWQTVRRPFDRRSFRPFNGKPLVYVFGHNYLIPKGIVCIIL